MLKRLHTRRITESKDIKQVLEKLNLGLVKQEKLHVQNQTRNHLALVQCGDTIVVSFIHKGELIMFGKTLHHYVSTLMLAATVLLASALQTLAAGLPTIDKTTVIVRANSTYIVDKATNSYKWGWVPMMDFVVNGPIERGSLIAFEMTTPDGKPWVAVDCETKGIEPGATLKIENCGQGVLKSEKQSMAIGQYGFKITMKNELQGTNQTLYAGKFNAAKVFYNEAFGNKEYRWFVDYDWALPLAEVFPDAFEEVYGTVREKGAKPLMVSFWFRGPTDGAAAYLFYQGKQIASTETSSEGTANGEQGITLFDRQEIPFSWVKNRYKFTRVLVSNSENPDNHPNAFRMDRNPGDYEVKVLRKGKLVRAMKFTVGADGRIVDNGVSRQNELGTSRLTFFATVTGDEDGRRPDLAAWKTTAFFGLPLRGLSAQ